MTVPRRFRSPSRTQSASDQGLRIASILGVLGKGVESAAPICLSQIRRKWFGASNVQPLSASSSGRGQPPPGRRIIQKRNSATRVSAHRCAATKRHNSFSAGWCPVSEPHAESWGAQLRTFQANLVQTRFRAGAVSGQRGPRRSRGSFRNETDRFARTRVRRRSGPSQSVRVIARS